MKAFYLVDPNLRDLTGHNFEYGRSLIAPVERHGYRYLVLGHKQAEPVVVRSIPFAPVFSRTIWDTFPAVASLPAIGTDADVLLSNVAFYTSLRSGLPAKQLGRDAVVLGHMIRPHQLLGWAWWYRGLSAADRPSLVLLFRYVAEWFAQHAAVADAFRILRESDIEGRVVLATDSERLARDYRDQLGQEMRVLPIPHTNERETVRPAAGSDTGRCHFVSLGNARDEKGILEILYAIRALHRRGVMDGMRFTLQVNDLYAPETRDEIVALIGDLKQLQLTELRFLETPLSSAEYYSLIADADVVLLPYWRSIYQSRTSGILAEALGAGKVVISTEDTWAGDQVLTYEAGLVCRDREVAALVAAMTEISANLSSYASRALAARSAWLSTHNPERFVDDLLSAPVSVA